MQGTCIQNASADGALADVAAELRRIDHRSGWSRTLAIGELMLKHFFNGNIREWRTHRRDKEASIRRLALRGDCPLGRSALSEAVAVYAVCSELPAGSFRDELSPSHVVATLKVDAAMRIQLLERAVACKWTVRELRVHVSERRKNDGERRGRPRASPPRAALTYLKNAALMLSRAGELLEVAHHVELEMLSQLQSVLARTEEQTTAVRVRLAKLSASPRVTLAPSINNARSADHDAPKLAAS